MVSKKGGGREKKSKYNKGINVDPHWSYADPDPQNLVNPDPDSGQKITKFIKKKVEKKKYIFKYVP